MRNTNIPAGACGCRIASKALYGGCRYATGLLTDTKFRCLITKTRLTHILMAYGLKADTDSTGGLKLYWPGRRVNLDRSFLCSRSNAEHNLHGICVRCWFSLSS